MSGAGRSTAAKELEDLGWFVVDNLPPSAAARRGPRSVDESRGHEPADRGRRRRPLRVVLRRRCSANLAPAARPAGTPRCCSSRPTDEVLVRRQEAARRPHPLQGDGPAARRDRSASARCSPTLRGDADLVIDTTDLNVHQLTDRIAEAFGTPGDDPAARSPWSASASSTASRSTPTSWPTCGSCPTRTGSPSCGRTPAATPPVADYVLGQPRCRGVPRRLRPSCSSGVADGYLREGKRFMHGRRRLHRRQAPQRRDGRGARRAAAARAASTPAPSTATWGASDVRRPGPAQAVVALGGGHGLAASLSRAAAARRRPDRRRAHRGRHGRRQRRLVRPAARRVRRAAARRPADGAGRAVRRRRVGPHLGRRAPAPVRRRGRAARPRRRQPADRRRSGSCSATTSPGSTGSAGCSARTGRVLPMALTPMDITAEVRGLDAGDPDALTDGPRPGRGRHDRRAGRRSIALVPGRPAGLPGGGRGDRRGRLGRARARARGSPR